jgi:hypothetical protein
MVWYFMDRMGLVDFISILIGRRGSFTSIIKVYSGCAEVIIVQ